LQVLHASSLCSGNSSSHTRSSKKAATEAAPASASKAGQSPLQPLWQRLQPPKPQPEPKPLPVLLG